MRPTVLGLAILALAAPAGAATTTKGAPIVPAVTAAPAEAQQLAGGGLAKRGNAVSQILLVQRGERTVARVDAGFDCGEPSFSFSDNVRTGPLDEGPLKASGAGAVRGTNARYRWRLSATITDGGGRGVLVVRGRRADRPCKVLRSRFRVLPTAASPGRRAAAPPGPAQLYGFMKPTGEGPRGMTLKLTDEGRVFARWPARLDCDRGRLRGFPNLTPLTPVRQGRFERRERFAVRYSDGVLIRYRARFSGHFTTSGAVGTAKVRAAVFVDGARADRCRSVTQRWRAFRPG